MGGAERTAAPNPDRAEGRRDFVTACAADIAQQYGSDKRRRLPDLGSGPNHRDVNCNPISISV
jgi:hypothetical protein